MAVNQKTVLNTDAYLEIPAKVAVCPICKGKLFAQFDDWQQNEDGTWGLLETGAYLDCENEPDIDSEEWGDWLDGHYSMPYVDWLPVCIRVAKWINKNYVFDMDE